MHVVTNRVFVHPDWQQEFETRFQKRAGQIDQQPGFIRMSILKPCSDESPYVVYTEWESQSEFQSWIGSDDFKEAHKNPMPEEAFTKKGMLEQHTVIISSESSK